MKVYITENTERVRSVGDNQQFYSVAIEVPTALAKALLAFEEKMKTYQVYLRGLQAVYRTRNPNEDFSTLEVPECLGVKSEELRREQDTEAPSSKPSRKKRKKTASDALMSPKKDG